MDGGLGIVGWDGRRAGLLVVLFNVFELSVWHENRSPFDLIPIP